MHHRTPARFVVDIDAGAPSLYQTRGRRRMIRRCTGADEPAILEIINDGAKAYRGVIPADRWHEPYMSRAALAAEIAAGVQFSCWEDAGTIAAVMGLQVVRDATLIRHAYVRRTHQRSGLGGTLLEHFARDANGPLLVGTWASAQWAIRFYERHGFRLVGEDEKNRLLDTYWHIPLRQRDTSVVLIKPSPQEDAK
jgi:N-acetylglutamate synthase-like GNAT family acetyltransferase